MTRSSNPLDSGPINDADLDRLSELLDRYGNPETGLNLEGVDGFLSAVVVGPGDLVMPSESLREILDCQPVFDNEQDARDTHLLLARLNNQIVARLQAYQDDLDADLAPIVLMPADEEGEPLDPLPDDFPLGAGWGLGFMRAVQLRALDWQVWCERYEDIAEDFSSIVDLTLVFPEQLEELGAKPDLGLPELADREEIVDTLPDILANMNYRRLMERQPGPAQAAEQAPRNAQCPCGSGRKYKKCCGDPARSLN